MDRGVPEEDIKVALRGQNWKEQDIADAFKVVNFERNAQADSEYPTDHLMKGRELMKRTMKIYKERIGTFLGIVAIPALLMAAVFIVGFTVFGGGFDPNTINSQSNTSVEAAVFFFVSILLMIPVFILQQIALMLAIKSRGERGILKFYRQAKDYFFKYLGTSIFVSIIVFGGFLLLIIPGIYFAIIYSLATVLVIFEGLSGMDALRRSKEYVKKDIWGYAKKWAYLIFVFGGLFILLGIIIGIAFIQQPEAGESINDLISFILMPIPIIYTIELYRNLKALNKQENA